MKILKALKKPRGRSIGLMIVVKGLDKEMLREISEYAPNGANAYFLGGTRTIKQSCQVGTYCRAEDVHSRIRGNYSPIPEYPKFESWNEYCTPVKYYKVK